MEKMRIETVDASIVRIEPGVVVDIDTGENPAPAHFIHDLAHDFALGILRGFAARPDPVEVGLVIEAPQSGTRRLEIADEQRHRSRQFGRLELFQHRLRRLPAGILVAMQQHRNEQRL
jgi:hypothetical protein